MTYERAWYRASLEEFLHAKPAEILGQMAAANEFDLVQAQRDAWITQTSMLQSQLTGLVGAILLEYSIPRMGRRADVVLACKGVIFVIEFKVGSAHFDRHAIDQSYGYALDLKHFHETSHDLPISIRPVREKHKRKIAARAREIVHLQPLDLL